MLLQDFFIEPTLVLLELAANLTGTTLQDDITRQFTPSGKDILNRATPIWIDHRQTTHINVL